MESADVERYMAHSPIGTHSQDPTDASKYTSRTLLVAGCRMQALPRLGGWQGAALAGVKEEGKTKKT